MNKNSFLCTRISKKAFDYKHFKEKELCQKSKNK